MLHLPVLVLGIALAQMQDLGRVSWRICCVVLPGTGETDLPVAPHPFLKNGSSVSPFSGRRNVTRLPWLLSNMIYMHYLFFFPNQLDLQWSNVHAHWTIFGVLCFCFCFLAGFCLFALFCSRFVCLFVWMQEGGTSTSYCWEHIVSILVSCDLHQTGSLGCVRGSKAS